MTIEKKNIVVCCDGTANEFGDINTNVVHTYELAIKNKGQIAFYDPGVGTGGWEYDENTLGLKSLADQATGHGLQKNVEDAYRYLMTCYESGDHIYLFGFSRGAFTARSLAGMLYKVGLLRKGHENLLEYASKLYNTSPEPHNDEIAADFKKIFSRSCPIYFIGVWDTVDSRVMNAGKRFADPTLNPDISFAYHALAIDEHRKDFPPCLWTEKPSTGQTVEQVWFAGVHADIGGGYKERGLANITLRWMLDKAVTCGMKVDTARMQNSYRMNPRGKIHESNKGFWFFRGSESRRIPNAAWIHASVKTRLKARKYAPKNLPKNPNFVR